MNKGLQKFAIIALSGLLLSTCVIAQIPRTEKRIYLVDLTGSMEGKGSVPTPNILQTVKENLAETINNIDDINTEVTIVPFTDRVWNEINGKIANKEDLITEVKALKVLSGDTNIADAWNYGTSLLDSTKINYLFLLTDGLHNNGPTKDTLFERLRSWENIAKGKYNYAFYVMLTPNAKESEICQIVDSTSNMWLIESMDINASLVRTSIAPRKNIYNDNRMSLSFLSNNRKANLDNLGLDLALEENDYYKIENIRKSPIGAIYSFDIVEIAPKMKIPLDTTLTLFFSYDTLANPFLFMTPDNVEFQIVNQGPRILTITTTHLFSTDLSDVNLKRLKYKEPFLGFFKWTRKLFEPTLNWPLFSSLKPDTASTETNLIFSWNEEAQRARSTAYINLTDLYSEYGNHIKVVNGNDDKISMASDPTDTIVLHITVIPGIPSTSFKGNIIAYTDNVDFINEIEINDNESIVGSWKLKYKRGWPVFLWIVWLAAIALLGIGLHFLINWFLDLWIITEPVLSSLFDKILQLVKNHKRHPRKNKKPQKERDKDDQDDDDSERRNKKHFFWIEWLEKKYLKAKTINSRSVALYRLQVALEKLKKKDKKSNEIALCKLAPKTRNDLEQLWISSSASIGPCNIAKYEYDLPMSTPVVLSTNSGEKTMTMEMAIKQYEQDFGIRIPHKYIYRYGRLDLSSISIASVNIKYEHTNCDRYKKGRLNGIQEEAAEKLLKSIRFRRILKKYGYTDIWHFLDGTDDNGNFIRETPLLFHEDPNCKTIYIVPSLIHKAVKHYGGISVAKIVNDPSSGFIQTAIRGIIDTIG